MKLIQQQDYKLVLSEINECLSRVDEQQMIDLINAIMQSRHILMVGAGRMGLMLQSFCARLNHLGFTAYMVGTTGCPPITKDDLLLVASSSGETPTVREIALIAHKMDASIFTITATTSSTIAMLSSGLLYLEAPSSLTQEKIGALTSAQPMKTLFEQSLFVLLECIVLRFIEKTGQSVEDLAQRHANLE